MTGAYWTAVVRDVLSMGYRRQDIFDELDLADMYAIVTAAPEGTALRFAVEGGWSREAHLLANMQESQAGMTQLDQPYERPDQVAKTNPKKFMQADSMDWDAMDKLDVEREAAAKAIADGSLTPRMGVRSI